MLIEQTLFGVDAFRNPAAYRKLAAKYTDLIDAIATKHGTFNADARAYIGNVIADALKIISDELVSGGKVTLICREPDATNDCEEDFRPRYEYEH